MFNFILNQKYRSLMVQLLLVISVLFLVYYFATNLNENLSRQNIQTGFGFLSLESGFDISETLIEYRSDDNYLTALYVGFLNTLKVSIAGNVIAILLGIVIGVMSFSSNYFLKQFSVLYVEIIRNIPLLLQLLFWYAVLTEAMPEVKDAIEVLPSFFLTNRGFYIPFPVESYKFIYILMSFLISSFLFFYFKRTNFLIFSIPILVWLLSGASGELSYPKLVGFNFQGGLGITPEFSALLFGLIVYTAAFIAEITRAGIASVGTGQWEAASSLGLSKLDTLKLIILPQSIRVIIPPLTSQLLNLTKNSSLAVAIGYPDFVSIANTTMNQTGQAIECVGLIMLMYLFLSLTTSFLMNYLNKKFSLKGNS